MYCQVSFILNNDKRKYSKIVADIPMEPNMIIKIIADSIRIYCILASFQRRDDIFNENIGISDTRRRDVPTANMESAMIRTWGGMAAINCDNEINPKKLWQESADEAVNAAASEDDDTPSENDESAEIAVAEEIVTISADQNIA